MTDMVDVIRKVNERDAGAANVSYGEVTGVTLNSVQVKLSSAKTSMTVTRPPDFQGVRGDEVMLNRHPLTRKWEIVRVMSADANAGVGVMTGARVYRTTNTTSPSTTNWWAVTFDSEIDDDGDYWNVAQPTRFTIRADGVYLVGANMQWNPNSSTDAFRRVGAIWLNGTSIIAYGDGMIVSQQISINLVARRRFVAGNYLELMAWTNIPNLVLLSSGATHQYSPVFWIERLR